MKYKRKINTILLLLILILFITIISFSFAAFTTRIVNSETSSTLITGSGVMQITFEGGEHLNAPDIIPSNDPFVTKTFTLTGVNSTEEIMNYHLILKMETNTFRDSALAYTLSSNNVNNNGKTVPSKTDITGIKSGTREIFLGNGYFEGTNIEDKVHSYTLKLYFPLIENFDHTVDQNKEFSAKIEIKEGEVYPGYNQEKGVNHPVLFTGMTPIKWDENNYEIETTETDSDWYDYDEKRWANAKSADGSYWVWIPRYAYKIESCYHTSGEDCFNLTGKEAGDIDVKFLKGTTNITEDDILIKSTGYVAGVNDTSMHHFLHPAFQFNGEELGFWVAKFEATAAEGVYNISGSCTSADDVTTKTLKILPNAVSWRCINMKKAFDVCYGMRNKAVYGWSSLEVDTHIMNNLEWGAIAYLSASQYSTSDEVWINPNFQKITGCAGTRVNHNPSSDICNQYHTDLGQKASTTHNIYGIYDMSGGAWEKVMANYNNLLNNTGFGYNAFMEINNKYKTTYKTLEDNLLMGHGMDYDLSVYGDAVYEVSSSAARYDGNDYVGNQTGSWFTDYSILPFLSLPWFLRGGGIGEGAKGGLFNFHRNGDTISNLHGFCPVLTPL